MAWNNSGISRLAKEQRIARNKQVAQLKSNEKSDDTSVTALTGIVSGHTSAIASNTSKVTNRIKTIAITKTYAEWEACVTAGDGCVIPDMNLKSAQILALQAEIWDSEHSDKTPTNHSSLNININDTNTTDEEGNLAVIWYVGLRHESAAGVKVITGTLMGSFTKGVGDNNYDADIEAVVPAYIRATGHFPELDGQKMRLVISYIENEIVTYA